MNYDNLYSGFKSLFPEYEQKLNEFAKDANAEESDGMHIMFSFVVIPFILNLLKKDDCEKLTKAFGYFEEMASSDMSDITEVLEFTIVENLMSNGHSTYDKAKLYMGDNMSECCKRAEQYLQIGE